LHPIPCASIKFLAPLDEVFQELAPSHISKRRGFTLSYFLSSASPSLPST
jgi:hypothetical protein